MAILIKQLHGTAEQFAEYLGEKYTIAINETTGRLHIMDGKTKGGLPLALVKDIPATPTAEQIVYKKTTVAAAIDDVYSKQTQLQTAIDAKAAIDDANAKSTTTAYSAKKVEDLLVALKQAVKNELLGGAGEAVDTLKELADLISTNKDAIAALQTIANGHVRFDAAQTLTEEQKTRARANIDAVSSAQLATKLNGSIAKVGATAEGATGPGNFDLNTLLDEGIYTVTKPTPLPTGFAGTLGWVNVKRSGSTVLQEMYSTADGSGRHFYRDGTVNENGKATFQSWQEPGAKQDLSGYATKKEVAAAKTQADKGVSDAAAAKKVADAAKSKADANKTAIDGLGTLAHKNQVGAAELAAVIDLGSIA